MKIKYMSLRTGRSATVKTSDGMRWRSTLPSRAAADDRMKAQGFVRVGTRKNGGRRSAYNA